MSKSFKLLPKKDISITHIINELPSKKNPFLAIAYPAAIEIKDRRNYTNDYITLVPIKQNDVFTLQGDASYVTESLDAIRTKNTSINQDYMSSIQNENHHFLSIVQTINQNLHSSIGFVNSNQPEMRQSTRYQRKKNINDKALIELTSNQVEISIQNNEKNQGTPKQYGMIVKNMYKRNHLSRKQTFQTFCTENSEKQNFLVQIASKFISRKIQRAETKQEENPQKNENDQLKVQVIEQCLTERGKRFLGKIIPFFN